MKESAVSRFREILVRDPSDPRLTAGMGLFLVTPAILLLGFLLVWPLIQLFALSLSEGQGPSAYVATLTSAGDLAAYRRTALMGVAVTLTGIILGSFIAWVMRTTQSRLLFIVLLFAVVFPLWTSIVVRNYALAVVFQRRGIINEILLFSGIIDAPLRILYTESAVFIGMLYIMLPYMVLPLYASFVNIDLDLMRAAQSFGASKFTAFRTIALPLAAPAMLATSAIVFVISIGFFVTPLLLGGGHSPFIANRISTQIFTHFDLHRAAAASVVLVSAAILILVVIWMLVGRERLQKAIATGGSR